MKRFLLFAILTFALLGVAGILYLTRSGPGVSGDAVHYMDGARNLIAGHGYARSAGDGTFKPITGFPPSFSVLMAVVTLFSGNTLEAGRWLNALLFGCNVFLMAWLAYRLTQSWGVSLLAGLFAFAFRDALLMHAWVMSEGLYIALTLAAFACLLRYWERQRTNWLVLAALAAGFSVLARYVGLALVGAIGLGLLLFGDRAAKPVLRGVFSHWQSRISAAFWFGLIGLLPLAAWLGRNSLVAGNLTARQTAYHPVSREMLVAFFDELSSWFVPNDLHFAWKPRLAVFGLFVLVGAALFLWLAWRSRLSVDGSALRAFHLQSVMATFMAAYLAIVFVNMLTLDASTSEGGLRRYLLPIYYVLALWMLTVFHQALRARPVRLIAGAVAVGLLGVHLFGAVHFMRAPGYVFGYTDARNASPELVAALQAIQPQRPLITNDYEAVYFLAGRPPYGLPQTYDNFTRQENEDRSSYEADLLEIEQLLKDGAVLVAYNAESNPAVDALTPKLVRWQTFGTVVFYVHPGFAP
ncbi:MAG: ArnT family glycosyltransferase [Chloroflexota bacterium]